MPADAQVGVDISIGTPPLAPIYEVVPAPRVGYVWAPGRWIAARNGQHWVADHWVHVDGPHGGWRHDQDHWNHD
jgi:hypothetical protein